MFQTADTPAWCRALPKVELHAHLNGSIPVATLQRLLSQPGFESQRAAAAPLLARLAAARTMADCFRLFDVVHSVVTDVATLRAATRDALHAFAADNVAYLELRTTPKAAHSFSAEEYLVTVLDAIDAYHHEHHHGGAGAMDVRLLVSLCRHRPPPEAAATVALVERLARRSAAHRRLIVGVELSGNPYRGAWADFAPSLSRARAHLGLPVSLHFAETPESASDDKESAAMLAFGPDRVGHAAALSARVRAALLRARVPVEVCLTSNRITGVCPELAKHPIVEVLLPNAHPFALCTDDAATFDTSLSREYALLHRHTALDIPQIVNLAEKAVDVAFCTEAAVLERVRQRFRDFRKSAVISG